MRVSFKIKIGATLTGLINDLGTYLATGALPGTPAAIDPNSVSSTGSWKPSQIAVANDKVFLGYGASAISIEAGTYGLVLKQYLGFDWTAKATASLTTVSESNTAATDSRSLSASEKMTYALSIGPNHVVIAGMNPYGSATYNGVSYANSFVVAQRAPNDSNRYDGVNSSLFVITSNAGKYADKRFGVNGGSPAVNSDATLAPFGAQPDQATAVVNAALSPVPGSAASNDGTVYSGVTPLYSILPGGDLAVANGELGMVGGQRGLGDAYSDGTRQWQVVFSGFAYAVGDYWQNNSIVAEVL